MNRKLGFTWVATESVKMTTYQRTDFTQRAIRANDQLKATRSRTIDELEDYLLAVIPLCAL